MSAQRHASGPGLPPCDKMDRKLARRFGSCPGGSDTNAAGGSHPPDERTKALPIPFRAPLRWVYKLIPSPAQRLVRRLRGSGDQPQQAAEDPWPEITIPPSVAETLNITPELVGSTYNPDEVLPMLALNNVALREHLLAAMDQADVLRKQLRALKDQGGTDHQEPELLIDEFLAGAREPGEVSHLVLANDYAAPGREYSNGFVHRRVKAYQAAGVHVDVVTVDSPTGSAVYEYDGVRVLSGTTADVVELLRRRSYTSASVHFLSTAIWDAIESHLDELDVHLFFHGYESSSWIRYASNYANGDHLDYGINRTVALQHFWHRVVSHPHGPASYIFVSDWWRSGAMDDLGLVFPPHRTHVIHNVIDTELFQYEPKEDAQRFRLLWVRSASARKYGHDLAIRTLQRLTRSRHWDRAQVTIVGDGQHWPDFEQHLGHLPNVTIEQGFVPQEEVARLHKTHGVFLVPSRHDTQGVSRDEAMASGLVPATNMVMAIPEFVDPTTGIVAGPEDADSLAAGIEDLWDHPEKFQRLSRAAAQRIRMQSGPEHTVRRELELFNLIPLEEGR